MHDHAVLFGELIGLVLVGGPILLVLYFVTRRGFVKEVVLDVCGYIDPDQNPDEYAAQIRAAEDEYEDRHYSDDWNCHYFQSTRQ